MRKRYGWGRCLHRAHCVKRHASAFTLFTRSPTHRHLDRCTKCVQHVVLVGEYYAMMLMLVCKYGLLIDTYGFLTETQGSHVGAAGIISMNIASNR